MSRINLTDTADMIADKIKRAKTDPNPLPETIEGLEGRAEAANLVTIYAALSGQTQEQVLAEFGGKQFSEFKPKLSEITVEKIAPITARMRELMSDPTEIDAILKNGADKARAVGEPVFNEVKDIMGFWRE